MTFLMILTALMGVTLVPLFEGWAISTIWGWFVVPLGAPKLSVVQAIGIDAIVSIYLIGTMRSEPMDTDEQKLKSVMGYWGRRLSILWCLGWAWVWRQFL